MPEKLLTLYVFRPDGTDGEIELYQSAVENKYVAGAETTTPIDMTIQPDNAYFLVAKMICMISRTRIVTGNAGTCHGILVYDSNKITPYGTVSFIGVFQACRVNSNLRS